MMLSKYIQMGHYFKLVIVKITQWCNQIFEFGYSVYKPCPIEFLTNGKFVFLQVPPSQVGTGPKQNMAYEHQLPTSGDGNRFVNGQKARPNRFF